MKSVNDWSNANYEKAREFGRKSVFEKNRSLFSFSKENDNA